MSNSQLASKNPGSGAGVRRVATASDRLPTIDFSCSDPQAPFEDIINRIMESYAISLARSDREAQFVAIFSEGPCESWTGCAIDRAVSAQEKRPAGLCRPILLAAATFSEMRRGSIHGAPQALNW
jgi:hypothetical protein